MCKQQKTLAGLKYRNFNAIFILVNMYKKLTLLTVLCVLIQTVPALVDVTIDQSLENAGFHRYVNKYFFADSNYYSFTLQ